MRFVDPVVAGPPHLGRFGMADAAELRANDRPAAGARGRNRVANVAGVVVLGTGEIANSAVVSSPRAGRGERGAGGFSQGSRR